MIELFDTKRWHFEKNHKSFRETHESERKIYKSKRYAFFQALDSVCQGNWVYDFYWWFIWSPFKTHVLDLPKRIRSQHRFKQQRIKEGFADEDIWGWDEMILEFFDKGFTKYIKQVWGEDVASWNEEQWKEWSNDSRPRKLYNKIVDFQKNMEGLRFVRKELEELKYPEGYKFSDPLPEDYRTKLFNLNNDETLCLESAWKNLNYILSKYHWSLWS